MTQQIPGTFPLEEDREFRYIQGNSFKNLEDELFDKLFDVETMNATDGGAISENCKITTENGLIFYGISYRGDILGWRKDFEQGATNLKLLYAIIDKNMLIDSLGNRYSLEQCKIEFY